MPAEIKFGVPKPVSGQSSYSNTPRRTAARSPALGCIWSDLRVENPSFVTLVLDQARPAPWNSRRRCDMDISQAATDLSPRRCRSLGGSSGVSFGFSRTVCVFETQVACNLANGGLTPRPAADSVDLPIANGLAGVLLSTPGGLEPCTARLLAGSADHNARRAI